MAKKEYKVLMPRGHFISWFVTTQADYNVTVTLRDSRRTYFTQSKRSTRISPPLALGFDFVQGEELTIIVDIPQSVSLKGVPHSNDIVTDLGNLVGKEFTLCLEDSGDDDYNDVAVSIIGWRNAG